MEVLQRKAEWTVDLASNLEAKRFCVQARNREMVAHIEARMRHHDHAGESGDRGFAVERIRAVDDQARLDGLLAGVFWVQARNSGARRWRCAASAAGDHARTRRGRVDLESAGHLKRLHEPAQVCFV